VKATAVIALLLSLAESPFPSRTSSGPEQPAGIWLDVPFVAQPPDGCGSATISMLLQYWSAHGIQLDPARADVHVIQRLLYSEQARGIYASEMEKYLRESGFTVFAIRGTWEDLATHLKQGRPLIVALQPTGKKAPLHYVLAIGIDSREPALFVNDPARGKLLRMERARFEKAWQPVGNWTLLAVPQQAQ
jgi:predicted double-glycine peptidase